MSNTVQYRNLYAFHPGYYIGELIAEMGVSPAEFARRMGTSRKTVSELLAGKCGLSRESAEKLSALTGMSIECWLNIQKEYDVKLAEIERAQALDKQLDILKDIDYSFFVKAVGLPRPRDLKTRVANLCKYLGIANLQRLKQEDLLVNYRAGVASMEEKNRVNASAWMLTALNQARAMEVSPFSAEQLERSLPEIRSMTVQPPEVFIPKLRGVFSDCGVAFVLLPTLKNSGINGAVKWYGAGRVMLALNDRRRYADTFWFALFHEIKHVLQQKIRTVFLSGRDLPDNQQLEAEADRFSADYLIPPEAYDSFLRGTYTTEGAIRDFALSINIHPGIVVGRLQNDGKIPHTHFNHLREQYQITQE